MLRAIKKVHVAANTWDKPIDRGILKTLNRAFTGGQRKKFLEGKSGLPLRKLLEGAHGIAGGGATIEAIGQARVALGEQISRGRLNIMDPRTPTGPLTAMYMVLVAGQKDTARRDALLQHIKYHVPEDPARNRIGGRYVHGPSVEAQRLVRGVKGGPDDQLNERLSALSVFMQLGDEVMTSPGFWRGGAANAFQKIQKKHPRISEWKNLAQAFNINEGGRSGAALRKHVWMQAWPHFHDAFVSQHRKPSEMINNMAVMGLGLWDQEVKSAVAAGRRGPRLPGAARQASIDVRDQRETTQEEIATWSKEPGWARARRERLAKISSVR